MQGKIASHFTKHFTSIRTIVRAPMILIFVKSFSWQTIEIDSFIFNDSHFHLTN